MLVRGPAAGAQRYNVRPPVGARRARALGPGARQTISSEGGYAPAPRPKTIFSLPSIHTATPTVAAAASIVESTASRW